MPPADSTLMRPIQSFAVEWEGFGQVFGPERLFAKSHPLVRKYPDLFCKAEPTEIDSVESVRER